MGTEERPMRMANEKLFIHRIKWPIRTAEVEDALVMRTTRPAFPWINHIRSADGVGNINVKQIQMGNMVYWAVPAQFEDHVLKLSQDHFVEIVDEIYPLAPVEVADLRKAVSATSEGEPYKWLAEVIGITESEELNTSCAASITLHTENGGELHIDVSRERARWFAQHLYETVVVTFRTAEPNELP
jgi:hypothetical protein